MERLLVNRLSLELIKFQILVQLLEVKMKVNIKSKLLKAQGVAAKLKNFPFDLKYEVISYDVRLQVGQFQKRLLTKELTLKMI